MSRRPSETGEPGATAQVLAVMTPVALVIAATTVFWPWAHEAREWPRAALVALLAALSLARHGLVVPRRPLVLALPWLAWLALGWSWAVEPSAALWGGYPTSFGAWLWASYALLLMSTPAARRDLWMIVWGAMAAAQGAIAVVQAGLGLSATGTLGHPMFLAIFMGLGGLVCAGLALDSGGWRRWCSASAALAALALVVALGRRGPLLVTVLGFATFAAATRPRVSRGLIGALLAAVTLGALLPLTGIDDHLALSRLLGLTPESKLTIDERLWVYRAGLEAVWAQPWRGLGVGTFQDVAARASSGAYFEARPHNLFIEIAFAAGLPGLCAALLAGLALAWVSVAAARRAPHDERGRAWAATLVGPLYGLHLMLNVDQPGVGVWVALLWGSSVAAAAPFHRVGERTLFRLPRVAVAASIVVLAGAAVLANQALSWGGAAAAQGRWTDAARWYHVADSTTVTRCLARRQHAAALGRLGAPTAEARIALLAPCSTIYPSDHLSRLQEARARLDADDPVAAARLLDSIAAAVPSSAEVAAARVEAYVRAGEAARALLIAEAALERFDSAPLWYWRSEAQRALGDGPAAEDSLRRARDLDGNLALLRRRSARLP